MRPISLEGSSLLCVIIITAFTKLSSETFTVQHNPYAVSNFELSRGPSECGENTAGNIFVMNKNNNKKNMNMKKDDKNSSLVHVSHVL